MDSLFDRIRRSIAQRGVFGTGRMCWGSFLALLSPAARDVEAQREKVDSMFDRQNGVETSGIVRPRPESVMGENWAFGIRYQPIDPGSFLETVRDIALPYPEFVFVDFGSGKGRALLLAAHFPFKKIIGVEYCEELNHIARRNLTHFNHNSRICQHIDIVGADAAEFALPDEPLVLYFFNPFGGPVMNQVVEKVVASFQKRPRRIVVIYFTPYFDHLWEETGLFKRIRSSPAVFDTGLIANEQNGEVQVRTE